MNRLSRKHLVLLGGALVGAGALVLLLGPFELRYGLAALGVLGAVVALYVVRALRRIGRRSAQAVRTVRAVHKVLRAQDARLQSALSAQQDQLEASLAALANLVGQDRFELVAVLDAQAKAVEAVSTQLSRLEEKTAADAQQFAEALAGLKGRTAGTRKDHFVQVDALLDLRALLQPRAPMPAVRRPAPTPVTLLRLVQAVLDRKPNVVICCGSGASPLWIGYALERVGAGRCIVLEHDHAAAIAARAAVEEHGLSSVVEVRDARLMPLEIRGERFWWYDLAAVDDVRDAGLVFVDGPPESKSRGSARFPAVPALRRVLDSSQGLVILANADRPDAKAAQARWCEEFGATVLDGSAFEPEWASLSVSA